LLQPRWLLGAKPGALVMFLEDCHQPWRLEFASLLRIILTNHVFVTRSREHYLLLSVMYFLQANGHRVMVVAPRHDQYKDAWDTSVLTEVCLPEILMLLLFSKRYLQFTAKIV